MPHSGAPYSIARYSNRRLYIYAFARYIGLSELRDRILAGETFQVKDTVTGMDVTNETLAKILGGGRVSRGTTARRALIAAIEAAAEPDGSL